MSAVIYRDTHLADTTSLLAQLRHDLGRLPGHRLHWQNLKTHSQRLHASQTVGAADFLTISSVVVCKRLITEGTMPHEDVAYLYTFRFLLERLSWLARREHETLSYTLSHVKRFKLSKLRAYEARLHEQATEIKWQHLDPRGGRLDNDQNLEQLQLADIAASAIANAFEPDDHGNVEDRYLHGLAPCFYRGGTGPNALTSYGLKMHPWSDAARAAYPWVALL